MGRGGWKLALLGGSLVSPCGWLSFAMFWHSGVSDVNNFLVVVDAMSQPGPFATKTLLQPTFNSHRSRQSWHNTLESPQLLVLDAHNLQVSNDP